MTDEQRIARAVAVATSEIAVKLCAAAERRTGRPRLIPLPGVLAAYIFHATGEPHTMTTSAVCRSIKKLKAKQRAKLGIPKRMQIRYKRMHSGWRAIKRVVEHGVLVDHDHELEIDEDTGELAPCPEDCSHVYLTLEEFLTQLVQASLPPGYERGTAVAIDGTDVESHTRPHRKRLDSRAGPSGQPTTRPDGVTAPPPTAAPPSTSSDTRRMSPPTCRSSAEHLSRNWPQVSRSAPASEIGPPPCWASSTAYLVFARACWTAATQRPRATSSPGRCGTVASRSQWTYTRHSVASAPAPHPE